VRGQKKTDSNRARHKIHPVNFFSSPVSKRSQSGAEAFPDSQGVKKMEDTLSRFFNDLFVRLDGPLHFRFFLQPSVAIILAIRDGLRDARQSRPPYSWSLFSESGLRRDLLRDGWKAISKVFIVAVALDFVYQLIVLHWFYPFETLLVAVLLALIPYLLVRGPVNRIQRSLHRPPQASQQKVETVATPSAIDPTRK
jgi:hypothetical protein